MNTVRIIEKQQVVCGIIIETNHDSLSSNSESFRYKASITGNTYNAGAGEAGYDANKVGKNETEVVIPLKHLNNFWKSLNIPLINCEVELVLPWSKSCVLADKTVDAAADPAIVVPTGLELKITGTKLNKCSSRYYVKRK